MVSLRPSRDHVASDLEIQTTVGRSIREYSGRASSELKRAGVLRYFFLTGPRHIFSEKGGGVQEKDRARLGLRHDGGRMRKVEGGKWREREFVGKAAVDKRVFIPDAIPYRTRRLPRPRSWER